MAHEKWVRDPKSNRSSPYTHGQPRTDIAGSSDKSPHNGVDFSAPTGASIYSNKPLQITAVKRNDDSGGFGNAVWAKETVPPYNTYVIGHLDGVPPDIQPGKTFPAGTKLAWTGDTVGPPYKDSKGNWKESRSTGQHLHFEVRDANNKHIDPDSRDAAGNKHVDGMGFEPGGNLDYGKPVVDPNRVRGRNKSKDYPKDKPLTGEPKPPAPDPGTKPPPPGTKPPDRPPDRPPITDPDPLRTLMEQQLSKRIRGSKR